MAERMSLLRVIEVRVLEEELALYRVVPSDESEEFESAFCSHYELGLGCRSSVATSRTWLSSQDSASASRRPADLLTGPSGAVQLGSRAALPMLDMRPRVRNLSLDQMTYSIFDSTGNLVDAFKERAAALDCLAGIAQAEPDAADEVYLVVQDESGTVIGDTIYASAVSVPA